MGKVMHLLHLLHLLGQEAGSGENSSQTEETRCDLLFTAQV